MFFKLLVILVLLAIVASLGSGLFFLVTDKGHTNRTVKALTVRIALSLGLFILLMIAYALGLITPHGIYPPS
ncbi:MAG: twin transmembrane helix small protein [Gammaproteobacteria bacterium]|nr:twin transmembrane helix small protein [Gammaproteobacteria bacterium]